MNSCTNCGVHIWGRSDRKLCIKCIREKQPGSSGRMLRTLANQLERELYHVARRDGYPMQQSARHLDKAKKILKRLQSEIEW
jgi:hypothetical protein